MHAHSYDDVVRAVRDTATYPSPVRALGNIHSVTYLTVNQGGTVVLMRNLRGVKDFRFDEHLGHQVVTVLGGTSSLEMYNWLGEKGYEAGFQAEIGDATVGSLAVSQNKDSGLFPKSEMGTTYKGIVGLKYVDHDGNIRDLNAKDHAAELAYFKCSDGLLGIVLEVTLKVYPQRLVHAEFRAYDTQWVIDNIHNLVTEDRTMWALLLADTTTVETRRYSRPDEAETPALCRMIKELKQTMFQRAEMLVPDIITKNIPFTYNCYRRNQVVSYYNPNPGEKRQDFAWYVHCFYMNASLEENEQDGDENERDGDSLTSLVFSFPSTHTRIHTGTSTPLTASRRLPATTSSFCGTLLPATTALRSLVRAFTLWSASRRSRTGGFPCKARATTSRGTCAGRKRKKGPGFLLRTHPLPLLFPPCTGFPSTWTLSTTTRTTRCGFSSSTKTRASASTMVAARPWCRRGS